MVTMLDSHVHVSGEYVIKDWPIFFFTQSEAKNSVQVDSQLHGNQNRLTRRRREELSKRRMSVFTFLIGDARADFLISDLA